MNMTDRPKKIAEEISGHIPAALMAKALAIRDKDDRCGAIGLLIESAVSESNLATHKGVDFWWNPESGFWVELGEKEMDTAAEILVRGMGLTPADIFKRESRLIQMTKRRIQHKSLNPKRAIISFKNCALDVESGKTLKLSPDLDCTYGLPYNYDKGAECPLWMSFLNQVLPDVESRMVLQEYLGCIFINRHTTKLEKILYLYGGGANGKSVVYETICGILGRQNVTNFDISHLASTTSEGMYALAECDGKLLNYCSDAGKKEFSSSRSKTIVSGEPTLARRIYGRPFEAADIPVMICISNELPVTVDSTYGFSMRLIIVSFDITIAEEDQDKQLHIKMEKEYSGILNWILQGRDRFIKSDYKFTTSKKEGKT
ncbi:MAG: phage/plasmid primase, P4 family [Bacteroidales bacterium]|nr:phage/plasmid primase, P4 family [Bacteroidales bacterium]